jgi:RHS repeat-associated protein
VALARKHVPTQAAEVMGQFGDWDLDVPRIGGSFSLLKGWVTSTGGNNRCSGFTAPPSVSYGSNDPGGISPLTASPPSASPPKAASPASATLPAVSFLPTEYWQGHMLSIPGQGSQEVLLRTPGNTKAPASSTWGPATPLVTKSHWQVRCLPSVSNGSGEGFEALSPEGVRYRFDWMATRQQNSLKKQGRSLARIDIYLMATQVTDRFGNWVRYHYDPASPMTLLRIEANDGRRIDITNVDGRAASATDGSRTFRYHYADAQRSILRSVEQSDGSRWTFELEGLKQNFSHISEGSTCESPGSPDPFTYAGRITHPSGAVGTFTTQFLIHGRTNVPRFCQFIWPSNTLTYGAVWPRRTISQTLVAKTIAGPGIADQTWTYSFRGESAWDTCTTCSGIKTVTVTDPAGIATRHLYGNRFRVDEGLLYQTDEGWNGTTSMKSTAMRYRGSAGQAYPEQFGTSVQRNGDDTSTRNRPVEWRRISLDGATFTWQLAANSAGLDSWARPLQATNSSSLGHSRSETTAYHDNMSSWVIGQVASITDHEGRQAQRTDYDAVTALPTARYRYDLLRQRYEFYPDGTLYRVFDPAGRATTWANYHRGQARWIRHRDGQIETAEINNLGKPVWHQNAAGTTTGYRYDAMGRLAQIDPPAEPTFSYFPIVNRFEQIPFDEFGLSAGHWRQTTTKGNAVTVRYYDALWRPRRVDTYDKTATDSTASRVAFAYDHEGQKTFESLPVRTMEGLGIGLPGIHTFRDAIGREILRGQDSDGGRRLDTLTAYMPGFVKRVTNPRGAITTFQHQVFDKPEEAAIKRIAMPEGVWLQIDRDSQGRALAITRGGTHAGAPQSLTRSYRYDNHKRLCKTVEPETGATIQWYDAAGNIGWRASGLALTGGSCDWDLVPANKRILMAYDERDRVIQTSHGDGSSLIQQSYTPDGQLAQITASRPGTNTIRWTYGYNNYRLLVQERYEWGDPSRHWDFKRLIDAHANEYALQDPHGLMDYEPNALGQPTRVGNYVTTVTYHPNGMVAGYVSGNGRGFRLTLNTRGLPLEWVISGSVHDRFTYDDAGNITEIADHQEGRHRSMPWYDGLDRLRQANGPWGSGSYTYDALENLVASSVGGRNLTHVIDPATNRLTALTGSLNLGIAYDDQGNVRSRGGQNFVFDLANRLISTPGKASYAYDGHGRRNLTWFADGSYRHDAYTQDGKLRFGWRSTHGWTRYVYLGDKLVAEETEAGVETFVHGNHLGSPVVRSDASGTILESTRTRYEPYGATVAGSFNPTGIGFTGHVNDPEVGMVYMQQRYYDPLAGRFLSVDPVTTDAKTGDSFNRYVYGNNNPYKFKDPDGRFAQFALLTPPGLVVAAVAVVGHYVLPGREAREQSLGNLINSQSGSGQQATSPPPGTQGSSQGCIYCVSGENTSSGRDYVGSTDNMGQRAKDTSDGRNRQGAEVVGTYDKGDKQGRRNAEQQAINDRGGKDKLDNKRNEVAPKDWGDRGIKPPEKSN